MTDAPMPDTARLIASLRKTTEAGRARHLSKADRLAIADALEAHAVAREKAARRKALEDAAGYFDRLADKSDSDWAALGFTVPNPVADKYREHAAAIRAMMEETHD